MHHNKSFNDYLKKRYNPKLTFRNIDKENVSELINNLSPKTGFGFDGISSKLLKLIKTALSKPTTIIIDQMINTGIFPDKLEIAKLYLI